LGKNKKSKSISEFRDKALCGQFLEFLKSITQIDLSSTKIDITSSKYEYSDYLLCHDDDIHDVNKYGRRIAFIYYLVDSDWNQDGSDGGSLDLFKVNGNLKYPLSECYIMMLIFCLNLRKFAAN
jgi:Rps23 Pro-64 3,4-dihydroxylase Tpa1-like proline 4-hydroxylase